MSTIIRTRSPFFIRTPDESDADLSFFRLILTIYKGSVGSTPACGDLNESITLEKKILPTETSVTFEISEIVNQYFEQTFTGTYSADMQSLWVSTGITARKADGTLIGSSTNAVYLAQEGFNTFKEGINFSGQSGSLVSTRNLQILKGDNLNLPIDAENVASVDLGAGSLVRTSINITDTGESNQKIQYITNVPANSINTITLNLRSLVANPIIINLEQIEECKFSPYKCVFLNRWGAFETFYFFKKSTSSLESKNETFNKSIFAANTITSSLVGGVCTPASTYNTYSTTDHSMQTFNSNAKQSLVLNTGFIKESMNITLEEILVSEFIWLVDSSNNVFPSILKESNLQTKTSLNDRLINYTMNFEMSFDYINNVR
tara:strand:+ start:309 stop:1436 length:1128 start_codon:yes stop_codon:yes gene_type:complete